MEADSGSGTNSVVLVFSNRAVCVGFWAYSASAVSAAVVFGLFPASPDANFGFLASFWLPLDGFDALQFRVFGGAFSLFCFSCGALGTFRPPFCLCDGLTQLTKARSDWVYPSAEEDTALGGR